MDSNKYIELATRTESVPAELKISQIALHATLMLAISSGNVVDQVKRRLFYGKPIAIENLHKDLQAIIFMTNFIGKMAASVEQGADLELAEINQPVAQELIDGMGLPAEIAGMRLDYLNIRLLHAAIGGFTENGEKLEALMAQYEGKGLDLVNFREENGDTQWYNAIEIDEMMKLAAAAGMNPIEFSEFGSRVTNITKLQGNAKLKGRYKQGDFDAVDALQRNLANERSILETSHLNATPANAAHLESSVMQLRAGQTVAAEADADGNFKAA